MRQGVTRVLPGIATASGLLLLGWACARPGTPPGGPPDRVPPSVIETVPDTFASIGPWEGPARIEFNERISERPQGVTSLDEAVLVSPRTGEVRIRHKPDALEVEMSGGFRSGLVYRITLLPVVVDMFGNVLGEPFEFVFSTGPTFVPNAVAGYVVNRITGEPVQGAEVAAVASGTGADSVVYAARSDSGGIFALRYLPAGSYWLRAFEDRDRDLQPGVLETQGIQDVRLEGADTVLTDVIVLPGDTTAARLLRVEVADSTTLRSARARRSSALSTTCCSVRSPTRSRSGWSRSGRAT